MMLRGGAWLSVLGCACVSFGPHDPKGDSSTGSGGSETVASSTTPSSSTMSSASQGGGAGQGGSCATLTEQDFLGDTTVPTSDTFSYPAFTAATWRAQFFTETLKGFVGTTDARVCDGLFTLVPPAPARSNGGQEGFFFYRGQGGPWLYQAVTGDFAFEIEVDTVYFGELDPHSGSKIVIGNPEVDGHWLVYALGTDDVAAYATIATASLGEQIYPRGSLPASGVSGRLLVCRVNGSFTFHRKLPEDAIPVSISGVATDFAAVETVHVGLSTTWWGGVNLSSLEGRFNVARFHRAPSSHGGCAALLNANN